MRTTLLLQTKPCVPGVQGITGETGRNGSNRSGLKHRLEEGETYEGKVQGIAQQLQRRSRQEERGLREDRGPREEEGKLRKGPQHGKGGTI